MKTSHLFHNLLSFDNLSKILLRKNAKNIKLLTSRKQRQEEVSFCNSFSDNQNKRRNSQRDFINSIIHELRGPLNAITGFSSLIKQDLKNFKSIENCLDYASEIEKAALDLSDFICDLLEVNSISEYTFSVNLNNKIDIADIIKRSIRLNYNSSIRKSIIINTEISEDLLPINLDAKRMKQIFSNLISNAIKYSPEGTEINIYAKNIVINQLNLLQVIVADNGFGMDRHKLRSVFKKYKTIENANSEIVDSFGLGLSITKELVELQNGKILVNSTVDKGSEFILEFPYL
jgi:signal transduction histidine kinase